ncbi:MAG TPA: hypothetical protein VMZ05_06075 [Spirochaetota bacterium]|nr:hypothetical protein [Spirochaetota bacterium]
MRDPIKWFEEAIDSGKYKKEVIAKIIACISEDRFNINEFINWVSEQLEKDMGKN